MSISDRDFEALSAYLDGELTGKALARLEARLETNRDLQDTFTQLQRTRTVMQSLPKIRAPRNYMLTPEMVGIAPKPPRAYPVLRLASVLATLLLIVVFMGDIFGLPDLVLPSPGALQFAESAVEEPLRVTLDSEIIESQLPEAPVAEEMDRAMPEAEAPAAEEAPLAAEAPMEEAEAMMATEEEPAADEDTRIISTLAAPTKSLADELGGLAEPGEEPPMKVEGRDPDQQFETIDQAGIDFQTVIRFTEIGLLIIALSTGLTAFYLYRRYR